MSARDKTEFEHRRVGKIALDANDALHFDGLPGFPAARSFALAQHDADSPFAWLASLDDADLAFVVAEPSKLFLDFAPRLCARDLASVGAASADEVLLLAVANVSGGELCLNLAAPIVVNAKTRRAAQVVLQDTAFKLRARVGEPARAQIESKPQR